MSFGRPPSLGGSVKGGPPDRGSFPLDHFGECKEQMMQYMDCLRHSSNTSTSCRPLSKKYLDCRMNKGLMERDNWRNLGLDNLKGEENANSSPPQEGQAKG